MQEKTIVIGTHKNRLYNAITMVIQIEGRRRINLQVAKCTSC